MWQVILTLGLLVMALAACDPQVLIADPGHYEVVALVAE
jgi:hypothetical protein